MARQKSEDPTQPITARIPQSLLDQIDEVVEERRRESPADMRTRGDTFRYLLMLGLEAHARNRQAPD